MGWAKKEYIDQSNNGRDNKEVKYPPPPMECGKESATSSNNTKDIIPPDGDLSVLFHFHTSQRQYWEKGDSGNI